MAYTVIILHTRHLYEVCWKMDETDSLLLKMKMGQVEIWFHDHQSLHSETT